MGDIVHNVGSSTSSIRPANKPVITVADNTTHENGTTFVAPVANANNWNGKNIPCTINDSAVNMSVDGTYVITYTAVDTLDRTTIASRNIIVETPIPPYSYSITDTNSNSEIFNTSTPETNTFNPAVLVLAQGSDLENIDLTQESVPQADGQYVLVTAPDGSGDYLGRMHQYTASATLFLDGNVVSAPNTYSFITGGTIDNPFDPNVLPDERGYSVNDIVFEDDGGMLMRIFRVNASNGYDTISEMGMNEDPQYTGANAGWSWFSLENWVINDFTVI